MWYMAPLYHPWYNPVFSHLSGSSHAVLELEAPLKTARHGRRAHFHKIAQVSACRSVVSEFIYTLP